MLNRRLKGFTLTEVAIAVAVAAILALISIPYFLTVIQRYRVSTAGDALYFYLQYARSEAVKRNSNVYVSFVAGDTWCYGINVGSSCDCATANSCSLATVSYKAAQQYSLSLTGISGTSIYFEGSHGAANTSGSVTFTQYNASSPLIRVSFGRLGNLQICTTDINGYTAC